MEIVIANEAPILKQTEVRVGATIRQILLAGDTPEGINFRLFRSQYQAGEYAFESPRLHHAFQQIRWAESGVVNGAIACICIFKATKLHPRTRVPNASGAVL